VRGEVFVFEFFVEFLGDLYLGLVFCGEDCGEGDYGNRLVGFVLGCAFFGQAFGSDDVGGGEVTVPGGEEDVVFHVWGDEVGVWGVGGEGLEFGFYGGG